MGYSRRGSDSSGEYVLMPVRSRHGGSAYGGSYRSGRGRSPGEREEVIVNNYLGVPQQRPRAASTGGPPAPTIINLGVPSEGGRGKSRSRSRRRRDSYSSSSSESRSRSRHHGGSRKNVYDEDMLPYKIRKDMDYAKQMKEEEEKRALESRLKKVREEEKIKWEVEERERKDKKKKEREAILLEAKIEEERNKREAEELKNKILKEEAERLEKEKVKKKLEEEEFERKVKEKFRKAGYTDEYIEDVLHQKKADRGTSLAIDLHRPTFIKVNRKYLHPDTLDHYGLPWEWDARDSEFIIIKKYIDHTFQDELFEHTRKIKERKLITGPYVKETKTITTLTPNDHIHRKGDKMYVVREKSKSPAARSRRSSWMFT